MLRQLDAQATETCFCALHCTTNEIRKDEDAQQQTSDGFHGGPSSMPVRPRARRLPNLASRGSLRGPRSAAPHALGKHLIESVLTPLSIYYYCTPDAYAMSYLTGLTPLVRTDCCS